MLVADECDSSVSLNNNTTLTRAKIKSQKRITDSNGTLVPQFRHVLFQLIVLDLFQCSHHNILPKQPSNTAYSTDWFSRHNIPPLTYMNPMKIAIQMSQFSQNVCMHEYPWNTQYTYAFPQKDMHVSKLIF